MIKDNDDLNRIPDNSQMDDSCTDINIYEYGDDKNNIKISVVKVWDTNEQKLLHTYEPIFSHYLKWMERHHSDESFINFLHYTKKYDDSIILNKTEFKIEIANGTIVDFGNKIVAEIDGMLAFKNMVLYLKGMQLWISDRDDPKLQYYYEMH